MRIKENHAENGSNRENDCNIDLQEVEHYKGEHQGNGCQPGTGQFFLALVDGVLGTIRKNFSSGTAAAYQNREHNHLNDDLHKGTHNAGNQSCTGGRAHQIHGCNIGGVGGEDTAHNEGGGAAHRHPDSPSTGNVGLRTEGQGQREHGNHQHDIVDAAIGEDCAGQTSNQYHDCGPEVVGTARAGWRQSADQSAGDGSSGTADIIELADNGAEEHHPEVGAGKTGYAGQVDIRDGGRQRHSVCHNNDQGDNKSQIQGRPVAVCQVHQRYKRQNDANNSDCHTHSEILLPIFWGSATRGIQSRIRPF